MRTSNSCVQFQLQKILREVEKEDEEERMSVGEKEDEMNGRDPSSWLVNTWLGEKENPNNLSTN